MPNPFLQPQHQHQHQHQTQSHQNKKGRRQVQDRDGKENPFLTAKRTVDSLPRRNCFSDLSTPVAERPASPPLPPPPPPSFDELFPSLTPAKTPVPNASASTTLNFKRVVQGNVQPQQQQPQPQPQPQQQQHPLQQHPLQQQQQRRNPFLSNANTYVMHAANIRCKNNYTRNHDHDDDDDYDEDADVAYDSAYTNYYKD